MRKLTFGENLNTLRRQKGLTQEEVAGKLGVTPQAVSKWENDLSCPDIMLLPQLAALYDTTINRLFQEEPPAASQKHEEIPPTSKQKKAAAKNEELYLKIFVNSVHGDNVEVQIPLTIIKTCIQIGVGIPNLSQMAGIDLQQIDLAELYARIEQGTIGEIATIRTENGDFIHVVVEEKTL